MFQIRRISLPVLFLLFVAVGPASASMLGVAGDYNLFTFGDADLTSDSQGSMAIGGYATLTNYSAASNLSGNNAKLVVRGTLSMSGGSVGTNGSGVIYADNPSLTGGATYASKQSFSNSGVDFDAAASYLFNASTNWRSLDDTGTTENNYGTITLQATDSGLNVFTISGSDLLNANSLNIFMDDNSTVLVNVSGASSGFTNMGISINNSQDNLGFCNSIIYNFSEATNLDIQGISIKGSVLAPNAVVSFNNGNINGQMIASSISGSGEYHNYAFAGTITPVPLPASLWLMGAGLLGFVAIRRRA